MLFYPLYQALGALGLQVLKYGLGLATMGLVYLTARVRGAHPLPAALFIAILLSAARYGYYPVRAQVFTCFFFALSLYLLERARLSGRWRGLFAGLLECERGLFTIPLRLKEPLESEAQANHGPGFTCHTHPGKFFFICHEKSTQPATS